MSHSNEINTQNDENLHVHVHPERFYFGIFGALIFLTVLTVGISFIHLGAANLAVAMVIASIKAALVVLFFMHLKEDTRFNALIFVGSLMFIGLFYVYTANDTFHRGAVDTVQGALRDPVSGEPAPGGVPAPP